MALTAYDNRNGKVIFYTLIIFVYRVEFNRVDKQTAADPGAFLGRLGEMFKST